uniref:outer membrane beta-barrel protein n=1 Tax=Myroides injenensis TaxID=1183151 RepID=UPI00226E647C
CLSLNVFDWWNINGNLNYHYKKIGAFEIENQYLQPVYYRAPKKTAYAGNLKVTQDISLPNSYSVQIYSQFMTKDILPQAEIKKRYSIDTSIKKVFDSKKAEVFFNATDIFNTLVNTKIVTGEDFLLVSTDFFETQVLRLGISYRF